jgi:4-diphosphocytidyl-2-C-methyl-D-erythritol kinase
LADRAWGLNLDREALSEVGGRVGSDVPFFFAAGLARCRGRGEQVDPLANGHRLWFTLAKPQVGLSTAAVFSRVEPHHSLRSSATMIAALQGSSVVQIGAALWNRLTQTAAPMCDEIRRALDAIARTRPLGAAMTGSGTSCYGLYRHQAQAESARRRLAAILPDCHLSVCHGLHGTADGGGGRIVVREIVARDFAVREIAGATRADFNPMPSEYDS